MSGRQASIAKLSQLAQGANRSAAILNRAERVAGFAAAHEKFVAATRAQSRQAEMISSLTSRSTAFHTAAMLAGRHASLPAAALAANRLAATASGSLDYGARQHAITASSLMARALAGHPAEMERLRLFANELRRGVRDIDDGASGATMMEPTESVIATSPEAARGFVAAPRVTEVGQNSKTDESRPIDPAALVVAALAVMYVVALYLDEVNRLDLSLGAVNRVELFGLLWDLSEAGVLVYLLAARHRRP